MVEPILHESSSGYGSVPRYTNETMSNVVHPEDTDDLAHHRPRRWYWPLVVGTAGLLLLSCVSFYQMYFTDDSVQKNTENDIDSFSDDLPANVITTSKWEASTPSHFGNTEELNWQKKLEKNPLSTVVHNVKVHCGSMSMALVCNVEVAVNRTLLPHIEVAVAYSPVGSNIDTLWSSSRTGDHSFVQSDVEGIEVAMFTIYRLRPSAPYILDVYVARSKTTEAVLCAMTDFTTAKTGIASLDVGGPYGTINGTFSYEMITLSNKDGLNGTLTGIVALDAEGYVVWYYSPSSDEDLKIGGPFGYSHENGSVAMALIAQTTDSSLAQVVNIDGEILSAYNIMKCPGGGSDPLSWSGLDHEARFVTVNGKNVVLTVLQDVKMVSDYASGPVFIDGSEAEYVLRDTLVTYDPWTGNITKLVDLLEWFPPTTPSEIYGASSWVDYTYEEQNSVFSEYEKVNCNGNRLTALSWTHTSSADLVNDTLLVCLRFLNTVAAFTADGSELKWALSSSSSSISSINFAAGESISGPHDCQLDDNKLTLFDDGNTKGNCSTSGDEGCYSRGVEFEIDFETGLATKTWEYKYVNSADDEAVFVSSGGSVESMDHGDRHLVGFTKIAASSDQEWYDTDLVVEANSTGETLAQLTLPYAPHGYYRSSQIDSLNGESFSNPFEAGIRGTTSSSSSSSSSSHHKHKSHKSKHSSHSKKNDKPVNDNGSEGSPSDGNDGSSTGNPSDASDGQPTSGSSPVSTITGTDGTSGGIGGTKNQSVTSSVVPTNGTTSSNTTTDTSNGTFL